TVKNLWKNGGENDMVEVLYLVEPNDDRNDESPFSWDFPFRAVTWVAGASKRDGALRVSGHQTFPFLTPRWELSPGDLYGTNSPGLTALGDAKGLQVAERHILVARSEERRVGKEPRERWAGSRKQAESLHE